MEQEIYYKAVSVKERLPIDTKSYAVILENGDMESCFYYAITKKWHNGGESISYWLEPQRVEVPEMTEMKWSNVEKDGYPEHNGDFLCKVKIEQECGVVWDKLMVLNYTFEKEPKYVIEAKMRNGIVSEYGCNYFNHDVKEPLTVTDYIAVHKLEDWLRNQPNGNNKMRDEKI